MYQIGDTVIYKNDGVCKITEILTRVFKGKEIEYYLLNPVHNPNAEIFVPKDNAELVSKMRKILTKAEILQIIEDMPIKEDVWISNEVERKENTEKY